MGILNTDTDAATKAANQVRAIARQQFTQLAMSGKRGYELIWQNPSATPTEVLAALGADAASIFAFAQLNIGTINQAAQIGGATTPEMPSVPSDYTLTFNPDGSATVTQNQSSSSSSSDASSPSSSADTSLISSSSPGESNASSSSSTQ